MSDVFLEVIVNATEASTVGLDGRDDIEDPLATALSSADLGEVTGGGGGMGVYIIDVEVVERNFNEALHVIKDVLRSLKVPVGTKIRRSTPQDIEYRVYD